MRTEAVIAATAAGVTAWDVWLARTDRPTITACCHRWQTRPVGRAAVIAAYIVLGWHLLRRGAERAVGEALEAVGA